VLTQSLVAAGRGGGLKGKLATLRLLPSAGTVLPLYAALVLAFAWAYTAVRLDADREQTLQASSSRFSAVTATLDTALVAMLNDGVGAAVAGANEVEFLGAKHKLSDAEVSATLAKMLTGGQYVRSLFIARSDYFVRSGRNAARESSPALPDWLTVGQAPLGTDTWVGAPIPDPDHSTDQLVPIARRVVGTGNEPIWAGGLFDFSSADALGGIGRTVGRAGIVTTAGVILAAVPASQSVGINTGKDISQSPIFQQALRQQNAGVVQGYAPLFRMTMMYAHERVQDYPIQVFAGDSMDSILAPWRDRRRITLEATAAASILLMLGTALIMRNQTARRSQQQAHSARLVRQQEQSAALLRWANTDTPSSELVPGALRSLCRDALTALGVEHASIWLIDNDVQALRCRGESGAREAGPAAYPVVQLKDIAPSLEALRQERVLDLQGAVLGAALDPLVRHALAGRGAQSLVAAAIRSSGELLGVLIAAHFSALRHWEADEIVFLGAMADQFAQVLGAYQREQILEELQVLAGELMRSQDEERRRIGRELHDSTGQTLAALELDLGRLIPSAGALAPEKRALLETCARLAHQCSSEIRTASYLLHPPLLDELGLVSALRWLTDGLRERSNIEVRLDLPAAMARLPREQEMALFRVAQEALTNVHRHSASPWVAVRLTSAAGTVRLEVEDAGRGLSLAAPPRVAEGKPTLGVGLAGMRERMRQMGGALLVEFRSTGTLIRASLPTSAKEIAVRI